MRDKDKKEELVNQILKLNQRINELKASEAEIRKAKEGLKESEGKLRAIFDNTTLQYFLLIDTDYKIQAFNKTGNQLAKKILGRELKEGDSIYDFIPKQHVEGFNKLFNEALNGEFVDIETNVYGIWWEVNFNPVFENRNVKGVCLSVIIVDDRKEALKELEENEERFRSLIQNLSDIIILLDKKGDICYVSPSVENILGYRSDDLNGRIIFEYIHPEDISAVQSVFADVIQRSNVVVISEFRFRHSDSSWIYLESAFNNLLDNPSVKGVIMNSRDTTERKQAEEKIKASLREKEVLLREIHHRVKNNLQVISSLLYLQSKSIDDKKIFGIFKDSQNRIRSMAFIHERLYQSDDVGKIEFSRYISDLMNHLFHSHGINQNVIKPVINVEGVFLGIDTAIPCSLIINELISNSLKHAFPAGKKGEIHVALRFNEDNTLTLIVRDNGIGFPKDLDFRNTQTLGLKLVNTLVNQLDGRMELRSNGGTEFMVTFMELKYKERR